MDGVGCIDRYCDALKDKKAKGSEEGTKEINKSTAIGLGWFVVLVGWLVGWVGGWWGVWRLVVE